MAQLNHLKFDPKKGDILVSVGDLIDRGPDSLKTLQLLEQEWFFAVMGNHEQMLLNGIRALEGLENKSHAISWQHFNGGNWYDHRRHRNIFEASLLSRVKHLPLAIEIITEQGRIGVIHAAVPNNHWLNTDDLDHDLVMRHLLWHRDNGKHAHDIDFSHVLTDEQKRCHQVSGIDKVVVGHTIMPNGRPVFVGNTLYLDVGSALGLAPAVVSAQQLLALRQEGELVTF